MTFCGIDPGNNGSIAAIVNGVPYVWPLKSEALMTLAFDALSDVRAIDTDVVVCMEKVHSMPHDGGASAFKFGVAYGVLRGICIALRLGLQYEPAPQAWKKYIYGTAHKGLSGEQQKDLAREFARKLYPASEKWLKFKKDADNAEALLLAHYARRMEGHNGQ